MVRIILRYWVSSTSVRMELLRYPSPVLLVAHAYNIDKKIDDGLPLSGKVTDYAYTNTNWWWGGGAGGTVSSAWDGGNAQWLGGGGAPGTVISPSSTSCYDNGGNASATIQYSMTQNNGSGLNCAASFRMQGSAL